MSDFDQPMSKDKEIKLKHVKVYDQLYQSIQDGTYPIGSQLPSEPELAQQMDVSRMTLRRALSLLQEDNLIHNIRGKGNFIKDHTPRPAVTSSAQKIIHPMIFCSSDTWNHVEVEFRIEPPTEFITNAIGGHSVAVIIADRWYKNKETDTTVGYTLSFIPIEMATKHQLNLNELEELTTFMENTVYCDSSTSHATFSHTTTGNFSSNKYTLAEQDSFILVLETIYDNDDHVMICNKHFIPIEGFNMSISTRKN